MDTALDRPPDPDAARPLPSAAWNPPCRLEAGAYSLRFAETRRDLETLQRLRFEVFNVELGEGLSTSFTTGRDEDDFDEHCQHLVVEHGPSNALVGTYRLQRADRASEGAGLYSAGEFDLATIPPEVLDDSVELGRACVHPEHRHRKVLFLLWRGLAAYSAHHGKERFFGCSSLTSEDPAEGLRFLRQLEEAGHLHPDIHVEPLPGLRCEAAPEEVDATAAVATPKLFGLYLRYGARVLGPPALDREFGTIDFLTLIEVTAEHRRVFG